MFTNLLLAGSIGDQLNAAFYGLDMAVFHFFGSMQNGFFTALAKIFTAMGSTKYVALIAVMGLVMCFFKRTRKVGFALVFAVIIGTLITNIIVKPAVLRIRPYNTLQGNAQYWAWYLGAGQLCESDYSFPSGHTTSSFAAVIPLFKRDKRFGAAALVLAVLIAFSRIYVHVHYCTDILFGVVLGVIYGLLGCLVIGLIIKLIESKKPKLATKIFG